VGRIVDEDASAKDLLARELGEQRIDRR